MSWQQPRFKSQQKLLAQDEKPMSEKKTTNLGTVKEEQKKIQCQEMTVEYFTNLSDSMPKHLQMVIKNKGNMTKYQNMWLWF